MTARAAVLARSGSGCARESAARREGRCARTRRRCLGGRRADGGPRRRPRVQRPTPVERPRAWRSCAGSSSCLRSAPRCSLRSRRSSFSGLAEARPRAARILQVAPRVRGARARRRSPPPAGTSFDHARLGRDDARRRRSRRGPMMPAWPARIACARCAWSRRCRPGRRSAQPAPITTLCATWHQVVDLRRRGRCASRRSARGRSWCWRRSRRRPRPRPCRTAGSCPRRPSSVGSKPKPSEPITAPAWTMTRAPSRQRLADHRLGPEQAARPQRRLARPRRPGDRARCRRRSTAPSSTTVRAPMATSFPSRARARRRRRVGWTPGRGASRRLDEALGDPGEGEVGIRRPQRGDGAGDVVARRRRPTPSWPRGAGRTSGWRGRRSRPGPASARPLTPRMRSEPSPSTRPPTRRASSSRRMASVTSSCSPR